MKEHILKTEEYRLGPESIDRISDRIGEFLTEAGAERREVLRNRLATECCLEIWGAKLGKETECTLKIGTSFGKKYLTLNVPGFMVDVAKPQSEAEESSAELNVSINNGDLISSLGLVPEYHYINGYNILKIWAPVQEKKKAGYKVAGSFAIGVTVLGINAASPVIGQAIYSYAVDPLYTLFMRMLVAICGPMVLFSILTSICGMGDMASFGKMGAALVRRFLTAAFLLLAFAGFLAAFFFPVTLKGEGEMGSGLEKLIQMIVEIAPADIVSPFLSGNALQIVFIGIAVGLTILFLSGSVPELTGILLQLHRVVQQIMRFMGRLMPYFMGVAILKLLLSSSLSQLLEILKPVLVCWGGCFVTVLADLFVVSAQTKTPVGVIVKKLLPASIIGLTTASSSAALEKMNEDCTDGLGVSATLADFGIPFGQVIFKPSAGIIFFVCALFAAEKAGVPINLVFLLMDLVISYVLSVSVAPIPGGIATCISILFLQLGIPLDYVAIAISVTLLVDNIASVTMVQLIQQEVFAVSKIMESRKDSEKRA